MATSTIKFQLKDILNAVSWAEISRNYFGKSNSWLYHKLDGIDGNGKPNTFNEAEMEQLRNALLDLANRITTAANAL